VQNEVPALGDVVFDQPDLHLQGRGVGQATVDQLETLPGEAPADLVIDDPGARVPNVSRSTGRTSLPIAGQFRRRPRFPVQP
jgi:hypothetical protein